MTWSAAVNVAVGLVLVFTVFSVAVSRINEFVVSRLQLRSNALEQALRSLFGGDQPEATRLEQALRTLRTLFGAAPKAAPVNPTADLVKFGKLSEQAIATHPTVAALIAASGRTQMASYLPSRAISAAVLDILAPPTSAIGDDVLEQAKTTVIALPAANPARGPLLRMLIDAGQDRDAFRAKLEHWYDDEMSRLTGWYKRRVQKFIIAYGVVLTFAFNVDTIAIAQDLWRAPVEQAAVAEAAASTAGGTLTAIDTSVTGLKSLDVPLGWSPIHDGVAVSTAPNHFPELFAGPVLLKLLGLLITVFALSFGAPFWFDVLGRLARLRNAGGVTSTTDDSKRP